MAEVTHPTIQVGRHDITEIHSLTVNRSYDRHASTFQWDTPNHLNASQRTVTPPWLTFANIPVSILLDDDPIFTGWAERLRTTSHPNNHFVSVSGRSGTADLIDSNPPKIDESNNDPKISLRNAVARVNDEYGTVIFADPPPGAVHTPAQALGDLQVSAKLPHNTEKVSAYINRICKEHRLIVTDNARGELVILRPPLDIPVSGRFEYGDGRLLSLDGEVNTRNLYSEYIVSGSKELTAAEGLAGLEALGAGLDTPGATYRETVTSDVFGGVRKRRHHSKSPQSMEQPEAKEYIEQEAQRRVSSSYIARIKVAGWRNAEGVLYDTGQLYEIVHPHILTDRAFLTGGVSYEHSTTGGQFTFLTLAPPRAWIPDFVSGQEVSKDASLDLSQLKKLSEEGQDGETE